MANLDLLSALNRGDRLLCFAFARLVWRADRAGACALVAILDDVCDFVASALARIEPPMLAKTEPVPR